MNSILNIEVSCFDNYDSPANPKNVNLLVWLKSVKYKDKVERIRAIEDKAIRDELKATLPAITASGLFSYRAIKYLLKHSGFIAIDIDFKGNENIGNFSDLKTHICNIKNVAYCGLSVSGRGYWCLIPIAYPDKHVQHFKALKEAFKSFGITIDDACKDVSRLRGYSYDTNGYFNHVAAVYQNYIAPVIVPPVKRRFKSAGYSQGKIDIAVNMINLALDGEKHNTLLKAAKLMGGYITTGEVDEYAAIVALESAIQSRNIDSFELAKKTIRDGIAYGKLNPIKSNYPTFNPSNTPKPPLPELKVPQHKETTQEQLSKPISQSINTIPPVLMSKAYVDIKTGKLYIPTPPRYLTYTVRDSIEAYNKRIGDYPCIDKKDIDITDFKVVYINPNTLTIDTY